MKFKLYLVSYLGLPDLQDNPDKCPKFSRKIKNKTAFVVDRIWTPKHDQYQSLEPGNKLHYK